MGDVWNSFVGKRVVLLKEVMPGGSPCQPFHDRQSELFVVFILFIDAIERTKESHCQCQLDRPDIATDNKVLDKYIREGYPHRNFSGFYGSL